jgi:hypothetical protein
MKGCPYRRFQNVTHEKPAVVHLPRLEQRRDIIPRSTRRASRHGTDHDDAR